MNIRNKILTGLMLVLFCFTLFVHIGLNISGPSIKARHDQLELTGLIQEDNPLIDEFYRHSFKYIIYTGLDKDHYRWFNEEGKLILSKSVASAQFEKVRELARDVLHLVDFDIELGYGYLNAVYVIEQDGKFLYLDYDTLETVYYREVKESL